LLCDWWKCTTLVAPSRKWNAQQCLWISSHSSSSSSSSGGVSWRLYYTNYSGKGTFTGKRMTEKVQKSQNKKITRYFNHCTKTLVSNEFGQQFGTVKNVNPDFMVEKEKICQICTSRLCRRNINNLDAKSAICWNISPSYRSPTFKGK